MINNKLLPRQNAVEAEADATLFGVLINSHLNFGGHISHVRKAASMK